jgi:hypothetical protein
MKGKNVLSATFFVAAATISALMSAAMLVPNTIGSVQANPCSTNGGDGGPGGNGGASQRGNGGPGGPGGNGGDAGDIEECTINIEDSVLAEP